MSDSPFGSDDNVEPVRPRVGYRLLVWGAAVVSLFSVSLLLFMLLDTRRTTRPSWCQLNLRQVGLALLAYAREFDGHYPDSLKALLRTQDISVDTLVCPRSDNQAAPMIDQIDEPGHVSYIYIGAGLTTGTAQGRIVAYEPLSNHRDGGRVLFSDARVEWWPAEKLREWLASE